MWPVVKQLVQRSAAVRVHADRSAGETGESQASLFESPCAGGDVGERKMDREQRNAVTLEQNAQTLYHPVGTARMGSDAASVVDEELRVRGVTRLRVADASVMPSIIRAHTNAPSIVIGEKAADLIRAVRTA